MLLLRDKICFVLFSKIWLEPGRRGFDDCLVDMCAGSKGSVKIRDVAVVQPPAVVRGMLRVSDSLPRGISRASIARGAGVARRSSMLRRTSAAAAASDPSRPSPAKQLVAMELASRAGRQVLCACLQGPSHCIAAEMTRY